MKTFIVAKAKHTEMKVILGIILLVLMFSCRQDIKFEEIIKLDSDFELTIKQTDNNDFERILIDKDSDKIIKLKEWFKEHSDNWESSIASWASPDISLTSNEFRFLVFKNFVVIGFIDISGKPRQYTRTVDKMEFDFLLENDKNGRVKH
jgi:hypothetical protein